MPENTTYATAERLGTIWCAVMHDSPMWPIHGRYECRACGRHYPVPWAEDKIVGSRTRQARVPSFRSVLLPIGIVAAVLLTLPLRAADAPTVEANGGAAIAFARYTAGLELASPWNLETIEIDASLPKLEKHGRLRAIRHLLPFGKPEYQVLELAGDQTVKQQVIVRYLSAEVRAAAIPRLVGCDHSREL